MSGSNNEIFESKNRRQQQPQPQPQKKSSSRLSEEIANSYGGGGGSERLMSKSFGGVDYESPLLLGIGKTRLQRYVPSCTKKKK